METEIISELDQSHPGIKDWLVEDNRLRPNISVAVDGVVSPVGLLQDVAEDSEVHFVAAIAGGRSSAVESESTPSRPVQPGGRATLNA
jgi:hypothetical protein